MRLNSLGGLVCIVTVPSSEGIMTVTACHPCLGNFTLGVVSSNLSYKDCGTHPCSVHSQQFFLTPRKLIPGAAEFMYINSYADCRTVLRKNIKHRSESSHGCMELLAEEIMGKIMGKLSDPAAD